MRSVYENPNANKLSLIKIKQIRCKKNATDFEFISERIFYNRQTILSQLVVTFLF